MRIETSFGPDMYGRPIVHDRLYRPEAIAGMFVPRVLGATPFVAWMLALISARNAGCERTSPRRAAVIMRAPASSEYRWNSGIDITREGNIRRIDPQIDPRWLSQAAGATRTCR
jgi:hypothetical protein